MVHTNSGQRLLGLDGTPQRSERRSQRMTNLDLTIMEGQHPKAIGRTLNDKTAHTKSGSTSASPRSTLSERGQLGRKLVNCHVPPFNDLMYDSSSLIRPHPWNYKGRGYTHQRSSIHTHPHSRSILRLGALSSLTTVVYPVTSNMSSTTEN